MSRGTRPGLARHGGERVPVSAHRDPRDAQVALARVVVKESDGEVLARRLTQQAQHQLLAGLADTEDDQRGRLVRMRPGTALTQHPPRIPHARHRRERGQASCQGDTAGDEPRAWHHGVEEHEGQSDDTDCGQEAEDLVGRPEPEAAPVELQGGPHGELEDQGSDGHDDDARTGCRNSAQIDAQRVRQAQSDQPRTGVAEGQRREAVPSQRGDAPPDDSGGRLGLFARARGATSR